MRDNGAFVDADDDDDDDDFFRRCFDNFTCSSIETKLDPHKYVFSANISPGSDRLLYDHSIVSVFPLRI